jgi:hypothetical protein
MPAITNWGASFQVFQFKSKGIFQAVNEQVLSSLLSYWSTAPSPVKEFASRSFLFIFFVENNVIRFALQFALRKRGLLSLYFKSGFQAPKLEYARRVAEVISFTSQFNIWSSSSWKILLLRKTGEIYDVAWDYVLVIHGAYDLRSKALAYRTPSNQHGKSCNNISWNTNKILESLSLWVLALLTSLLLETSLVNLALRMNTILTH